MMNSCLWGSGEAVRKEQHVARFLEREYRAAGSDPGAVARVRELAGSGPMWEETGALISDHYDERLEFFESFLDHEYLAYSMAYFGDTGEEVLNSERSLEQAQESKFRLICERMGLQGDEHIFNLGCGFGSLERYILSNYPDIRMTGITPSRTQYDYVSREICGQFNTGGQERVRFLNMDFSTLSGEEVSPGSYDLVTSIGVVEHARNLELLNEKIAWLLRPGGKAFHHFIVSKVVIPQFLDARDTLIGSYFPGGRIWPLDEFGRHDRHLRFEKSWFVNGMNYWRTLDEWHKNFSCNVEKLAENLDPERIRYWNDYFILCKACFLPGEGAYFGNGHYLFSKPE